ncbi:MAG: response regulator [Colwellia sp.]|jgi:Response regulator containing a CheY-like receiver domain and a GGDEF domain
MNNKNILIVDDSKENRMLLRMMLEDDYQISEAESGSECLAMISDDLPDLVLLDVKMPEMTGYEVCTRLRQNTTTENLPIIFVSALDSTEERLAGFEVGGDEYVIKPVDGNDLFSKINSCLNRQKATQEAHVQAQNNMRVALEAMTVSSELGQIIEFIKRGQEIHSFLDIGRAVLSLTQEFCVNASVMIDTDQRYFFGCENDSMEARFLEKIKEAKDRIISIGIRTIVQDAHIVLLIKDMPLDNENHVGRLRDHMAVIMDIANSFVVKLNNELSQQQQRKQFLAEVIAIAETQIQQTSEKLAKQQLLSNEISQQMVNHLEEMLFGLGLYDDQEQILMKLASDTSYKLNENSIQAKDIDQELNVITERLKSLQSTT